MTFSTLFMLRWIIFGRQSKRKTKESNTKLCRTLKATNEKYVFNYYNGNQRKIVERVYVLHRIYIWMQLKERQGKKRRDKLLTLRHSCWIIDWIDFLLNNLVSRSKIENSIIHFAQMTRESQSYNHSCHSTIYLCHIQRCTFSNSNRASRKNGVCVYFSSFSPNEK